MVYNVACLRRLYNRTAQSLSGKRLLQWANLARKDHEEALVTIIAILLATGAAIAWVLVSVLSKPVLRYMDMFSYGSIRPLFALIFVIPYQIITSGFRLVGWNLLAIAVVAGIIDSLVGSMLFYQIVERRLLQTVAGEAQTAGIE